MTVKTVYVLLDEIDKAPFAVYENLQAAKKDQKNKLLKSAIYPVALVNQPIIPDSSGVTAHKKPSTPKNAATRRNKKP